MKGLRLSVAAALVILPICSHLANASGVVITQIYGGGGNTGAPYQNDFVELFNNGAAAVSVQGWSIQFATATGTTWQVTNLSGSIAPFQYFLVAESGSGANGAALPAPDISGTINLSSASGKVALLTDQVAREGTCTGPTGLVDFAGYGVADCYDGSAAAPAGSNTKVVLRSNRCYDNDDNAQDFSAAAPIPHNTQIIATCPFPPPIDYVVLQFPSSTTATACQPAGTGTTIYGRIYINAVTGQGVPQPGIVADVGVGPSGTNPSSAQGWSWSRATYNVACSGCGNVDEYQQSIPSVHESGGFDYAFRFSYQGGAFVYADLDGSTNGYSAAQAGQLSVAGNDIYCARFDP